MKFKKKVILNFPITSDYTEDINDLIAEEEIFSEEEIRKYVLERFFEQLSYFNLEERPEDLVSIEMEDEE